ncbi:class I SAM-dependent methyltransferase [Patescibacteria group bacterium]|nr:class I SAM-dependent methyltransferase [Patescibacteria group bacterium]
MTTNFYNKVAKKFGNYHTDAKYIKEYPNGDPEEVFKEKLLELSGEDGVALDVGCADGRFTLSIASSFQRIIAIDLSQGMLEAARKLQQEKRVENVSFEEQNASKTTFTDGTFNLVFSRRGPTPFFEFHRLLKPDGYFVGINIGERDCVEIKKIFGRGQGYEEWNSSRLEKDKQELEKTGFVVVFAQDYFYDEYYASYKDLDVFLQGVPIFEDFDSEKDKKFLEEYVAKFKTEKGIRFPRHRVVIVAKKV